MVEVTFLNPYSHSEGAWSYGINFISADGNVRHDITFQSKGTIAHTMKTGSGVERLLNQPTSGFRNGGGSRNRVRVVAIEEEGWLFVNDNFLNKLELKGLAGRTTVLVCAYPIPDLIVEEATKFLGFTIWKWHPDLATLPD